MNTLGWIFILAGLMVVRSVYKGRIKEIGVDLSDGFLAFVQGDVKGLQGVLARTGEGFVPAVGVTGTAIGGAAGNWATGIISQYKLGNVKPHVAEAAKKYGQQFGVKDIGGYRAVGSVSNSDHPKGRALDFMIDAKTDKARGDALAAALLADPMVTYVIWDKKINTKDGRDWRDYEGPSDHTDHVHASFKEV